MSYTISINEEQIFTAVKAWITYAVEGEVVQGYTNRVSMPKGGFVEMSGLMKTMLSTVESNFIPPTFSPDAPGLETNTLSVDYHLQIDAYGPDSADWTMALNNSFNNGRAFDFFQDIFPGIAPLYMEDPHQTPLVNGEQQYEARWTMVIHLQYKPAISDVQDSAAAASVSGIFNVDAEYHG